MEEDSRSAGKHILKINCDETNICVGLADGKGLKLTKKNTPAWVSGKSEKRGSLSHLAFICDDSSIQPLLPQVIVGNKYLLLKRAMDELAGSLPGNVYLIRHSSSWLDGALFAAAISWLAAALSHLRATHDFLLLLDSCTVHFHETVLRTAKNTRYICALFQPTTLGCYSLATLFFPKIQAFLVRSSIEFRLRLQT